MRRPTPCRRASCVGDVPPLHTTTTSGCSARMRSRSKLWASPMRGMPAAAAGPLEYSLVPTTRSPAPAANSIAVAPGARLTMRCAGPRSSSERCSSSCSCSAGPCAPCAAGNCASSSASAPIMTAIASVEECRTEYGAQHCLRIGIGQFAWHAGIVEAHAVNQSHRGECQIAGRSGWLLVHRLAELRNEIGNHVAFLEQQRAQPGAELGIAQRLQPGFGPQHVAEVAAVNLAVEHLQLPLRVFRRQTGAQDLLQSVLNVLMIALEKLDEQLGLAAEIRMKGAARIAGVRGDVLNTGAGQPFPGNDDRTGFEQPRPREITACLASQPSTCHTPMIPRAHGISIGIQS